MKNIPPLHLVTDDGVLARQNIMSVMQKVLEAGSTHLAVHIRGPTSSGRKIHELVTRVRPIADMTGGSLFLNDRVDIALTVRVDGLHLGQRSIPVSVTRDLMGHSLTVGASVHDENESISAKKQGADYAFVGTLFRTPSHHGISPHGALSLSKLCSTVGGMPLLGIGGITPERVGSVLDAGAKGVAVMRGIWDAQKPEDAVRAYLSQLMMGQGEQS